MTTGHPRTDLGAYVLGGLEASETAGLEAHLATCAHCRNELAELRQVTAALEIARDAPPTPPADLRTQVVGQVGSSRARWSATLLAALIGMVALVLGGAIAIGWQVLRDAPDMRVALTAAAQPDIDGEAALRQEASGVRIELRADGVLPWEDGDGGYYRVWLHTSDGIAVSAGSFVGPDDGRVGAVLHGGGQLAQYERLTVTWHARGADEEVVAAEAVLSTDP